MIRNLRARILRRCAANAHIFVEDFNASVPTGNMWLHKSLANYLNAGQSLSI